MTCLLFVGNPIGEPGARSLIEVFDANPKLQSLLGVEPGCTSLDISQKNMQPHDCIILAHEMKAGRAIAVVASVNVIGACPTLQPISTSVHQFVSIRNPCMLAATISEY